MAGEPLLVRNSSGDWVRHLQERLRAAGGSPNLAVDGDFGDDTEQAVIAFQRDHHLKLVDGKAGPETWAALESAAAPAWKEETETFGPGTDALEIENLRIESGAVHYSVRNTGKAPFEFTADRLEIIDATGARSSIDGHYDSGVEPGAVLERSIAIPALADGDYTANVNVWTKGGGYAGGSSDAAVSLRVAAGVAYPSSETPLAQVNGALLDLALVDFADGWVTWQMWNHGERDELVVRSQVQLRGGPSGTDAEHTFTERIGPGQIADGSFRLPNELPDARYTVFLSLSVDNATDRWGPYPSQGEVVIDVAGGAATLESSVRTGAQQ